VSIPEKPRTESRLVLAEIGGSLEEVWETGFQSYVICTRARFQLSNDAP
jgi:hypothetical protein